jgi:hypothetical protein
LTRLGQKRFDEAWQQSEPLNDGAGDNAVLTWKAEEVFDDQVETLALKPVECLEQSFRGSVHPSLIHVHDHEPMQQRALFLCAPAGVIRHHVVSRVKTQTVLSR